MNAVSFISGYAGVAVMGTLLTQMAGKRKRPLLEGFLAWLFIPLGMIACVAAVFSDGVKGIKIQTLNFCETLLNLTLTEKKQG